MTAPPDRRMRASLCPGPPRHETRSMSGHELHDRREGPPRPRAGRRRRRRGAALAPRRATVAILLLAGVLAALAPGAASAQTQPTMRLAAAVDCPRNANCIPGFPPVYPLPPPSTPPPAEGAPPGGPGAHPRAPPGAGA